ncbi:MAG: branched-chain amino acid aminotransferase, partial [Pseudomonadota bacterium]
ARARGIEVVERTILPEELGAFEGCFVTGTAAEVTPVGEVGPHRYKVTPTIKQLVEDFAALVRPEPAAIRKVA